MATAYGVQSAKTLDTSLSPAAKLPVPGGAFGGRVRTVYDEFTIPASGAGSAQNDAVVMGQIRKGERVIDGELSYGALGASVTLAWGVVGDTGRYRAATAAATAGQGRITTGEAGRIESTADENVLVTIGGAAPTAGIKIKSVLYLLSP